MGTQSSEVESESNKLKRDDGVCDERRGGRQGFRRPANSHRGRLYATLDGVEQERTTPESLILLYTRVQRQRESMTPPTARSTNTPLSALQIQIDICRKHHCLRD